MKKLILILLPLACLAADQNLTMREGGIVRGDAAILASDYETGIPDDLSETAETFTVAGAKHVPATATVSGCYSFDGTNDRIIATGTTAGNFVSNATFTIAFWVKPSATGGYPMNKYEDADNRWHITLRGEVSWSWFSRDGGTVRYSYRPADGTGTLDAWQHVCYVNTGSTHFMYVNGAYLAPAITDIFTPGDLSNTDPVAYGARSSSIGDNEIAGLLDEPLIYEAALTAAEVAELYYKDKPRHP